MQASDSRQFADGALRQFLQNPWRVRDLLRDVAPQLADLLDWSRATAEPADLLLPDGRERRGDVYCRVPFLNPPADGPAEATVLILIEHQSRSEPEVLVRLCLAAAHEWERQWRASEQGERSGPLRLTAVVPIVVHTGSRPWTGPRAFAELFRGPAELQEFVPQLRIALWELSRRSPEELAAAGPLQAVLLAARADGAGPEEYRAAALAALEALHAFQESGELPAGSPDWRDALSMLLQWTGARRPPEEFPVVRDALAARGREWGWDKEIEPMANTFAEKMLTEGEARGLVKGRAEGEARGRAESLLRYLHKRFGVVPEAFVRRVEACRDVAALDAAYEAALDGATIEDIQLPDVQ